MCCPLCYSDIKSHRHCRRTSCRLLILRKETNKFQIQLIRVPLQETKIPPFSFTLCTKRFASSLSNILVFLPLFPLFLWVLALHLCMQTLMALRLCRRNPLLGICPRVASLRFLNTWILPRFVNWLD